MLVDLINNIHKILCVVVCFLFYFQMCLCVKCDSGQRVKVSVNTIFKNNSRINNCFFFTNGNGILATPVCEMITHVLMQYY